MVIQISDNGNEPIPKSGVEYTSLLARHNELQRQHTELFTTHHEQQESLRRQVLSYCSYIHFFCFAFFVSRSFTKQNWNWQKR
jgi:hypothetical protein